MSTLLSPPPYDPERDRRRKRIVITIIVVILVLAVLAWRYRNWPAEHEVSQFFAALQAQDYKKAYGIWQHDPDWQQHADKYKDYPYSDFYRDWGPGGEWGLVKSYKVYTSVSHGNGVIVIVTVNGRADKAQLRVNKPDKTLGVNPFPVDITRDVIPSDGGLPRVAAVHGKRSEEFLLSLRKFPEKRRT
jgi:hypothetical protein